MGIEWWVLGAFMLGGVLGMFGFAVIRMSSGESDRAEKGDRQGFVGPGDPVTIGGFWD